MRRDDVLSILTLATERLQVNDAVETLALVFEREGVRAMDAVHLALASLAAADFFCTCDDKLFRKAQSLSDLPCSVATLLSLVPEVTK